MMNCNYTKVNAQDICEITSSKRIYASDYINNGVPFYRGKEIIEKQKGLVDVSTKLFISEEKYFKIKEKFGVPESGDLLLTSVGTLGIPYVVKPSEKFYFKDGNLIWFRKLNKIVSEYLYYWLLSPIGKAELKKCTIGASQAAFTIALLKNIEIVLPPIMVQNKIATILSAYDDLIENNLRRIKILEEMAQNLYREWFVNFRFPGHEQTRFVDSPLGLIPEGWEVVKLHDIVDVIRGLSYSGRYLSKIGMPMHNLNSINEGGGYKYSGIKYYSGPYKEKDTVVPGDVIVANTEQAWERRLIGFAATIPKFFGNMGIYSHHLYRVRPLSSSYVTKAYVYLTLSESRLRDWISRFGNGTTINMLPSDALSKTKIVLPPKQLVDELSRTVVPIIDLKESLYSKASTLRQTRDLLLPKLIAGEVDVSELDIKVPEEEAV